jgi:hypothetical protein
MDQHARDTPPTDRFTDLTGDQGPFTDIQFFYWSGTKSALDPDSAWLLPFDRGFPTIPSKDVSAGDVAAVPAPGTAVLIALGLLGLGASRRVRRATSVIRVIRRFEGTAGGSPPAGTRSARDLSPQDRPSAPGRTQMSPGHLL